MAKPKYPKVHVKLTGQDGNAFFILGRVGQAMKRAGLTQAQVDEYHAEATAGDYDHLLAVTMNYVSTS